MDRFVETYSGEEFDVLVIGGGITGAAVVYEAASRGLKAAMVEKSDFGGATSAATSKMIHGGFRYLTKFEIGLVRESLRERRILTNIAPNLVFPFPFAFTHYRNDKYPGWMIKMGMIFYDLLSFDKNWLWDKSKKMPCHKSLGAKELMKEEPEVRSANLKGASLYYDCMNFSPERLTLAFIKSAYQCGAKISNYTEVKEFGFEKQNDGKNKITGVKIYDKIKNKTLEIKGKVIINCAGPWADIVVNKAIGGTEQKQIRRSEGIHIITKKLVNKYVITATTKSGRHCFVVPWRDHSLIGTTDKEYIGNPDDYRVSKSAVNEMLNEVNEVFGNSKKLSIDDVQYAFGGLRPLVEDQTKDSYESSRKYEIVNHKKDGIGGLITVEGGKYTTSRNLAKKVVGKVFRELNVSDTKSKTHKKYLFGSEIKNLNSFISEKQTKYDDFEKSHIEYLAKIYGTELDAVIEIAINNDSNNICSELSAHVIYAIRNEMAHSLSDILLRRTGIGTLGHPGKTELSVIAIAAAKELGWSDKRKEEEIQKVHKLFEIAE